MGRRLILDTAALIADERGTIDQGALDEDDMAVASLSIAEYRVGTELDTQARAAERSRALRAIASTLDVLDYTQDTAVHHARLLAHVRRTGTPRGARPDHRRARRRGRSNGVHLGRQRPVR